MGAKSFKFWHQYEGVSDERRSLFNNLGGDSKTLTLDGSKSEARGRNSMQKNCEEKRGLDVIKTGRDHSKCPSCRWVGQNCMDRGGGAWYWGGVLFCTCWI